MELEIKNTKIENSYVFVDFSDGKSKAVNIIKSNKLRNLNNSDLLNVEINKDYLFWKSIDYRVKIETLNDIGVCKLCRKIKPLQKDSHIMSVSFWK